MYLCKIAMDIVAKKMLSDEDGVRIAELDEMSYLRELWEHPPLTDFWRVGREIANLLAPYGIVTMSDLSHCFDYETFGRELFMYDYSMGAYLFSALPRQRNIHVFRIICPRISLSPH